MMDTSRGLAALLALTALVGFAHADDTNSGDAAVIANENAQAAVREGVALGQGAEAQTAVRAAVPETNDPRHSAFWVPAPYLRQNSRRPILQTPQPSRRAHLPEGERPWSFQWWPSAQAQLALRNNHPQSPLEKYDTLVADRRGGGAPQQGAALWEANPDHKHNTGRILGPGGGVERAWRQVGVDVRGVGVQGAGQSGFVVDGQNKNVEFYELQQWNGVPIDVYFFRSDRVQGQWDRAVRIPSRQHHQQQGAYWYHVYWAMEGGRAVQRGNPRASVQNNSGGTSTLTHNGRRYNVIKQVEQWQGQTIDIYYYETHRSREQPELPAHAKDPQGRVWSRFVMMPGASTNPDPSTVRWMHIYWDYTERAEGVQWEGHCMGYAAASILFREPPARRSVRLENGNLYRLRAATTEQANRANLRYESAGRANQVTFENRDLKGLATVAGSAFETSFSYPDRQAPYSVADFGTAVREGNQGDQAAWDDIKPHHMHRIFIDFLGERNRSVVMDLSRDESVFNAAVFQYDYEVLAYRRNPSRYSMRAVLGYAGYADQAGDRMRGLEPKYWLVTFDIFLDGNNRVINSRWTGDSVNYHPDFIWTPVRLGRAEVILGRYNRNPVFDADFALQNILVDARGNSLLKDWAR